MTDDNSLNALVTFAPYPVLIAHASGAFSGSQGCVHGRSPNRTSSDLADNSKELKPA